MNVLITGVAGFTGYYLANLLAESGHKVSGLAEEGQLVPYVEKLFAGNLNDASWLKEVISELKPDVVVHLAAISFVAHGDANEIYATNLLGTRNLLESLKGANCQRVLLASSANVYGNASGGVKAEETWPAPANDYAVSKLAMEYLASTYSAELPIVIARPFNYTGVGQSTNFLIPKIISHFKQRETRIELGNLDVSRDFSDVRFLVGCYQRLLESPSAVGQTFNVCSGKAVSLSSVLDMVRSISGYDIDVQVNPAFVRQNEVPILLGSRAKLESVIGPVSDIPLEETLEWMLDAHV